MTERPILFQDRLVQAILADRKTQTRRIIKGLPDWFTTQDRTWVEGYGLAKNTTFAALDSPVGKASAKCPYGTDGDILWVREAWSPTLSLGLEGEPAARYRASGDQLLPNFKWRPSIHMHRYTSRINLKVDDVRAERLNDISEADAVAEGIQPVGTHVQGYDGKVWLGHDGFKTTSPRVAFSTLWDSINKDRGYGWHTNPWVWVVKFHKVKP